jgi:hypothetical protein
LAKLPPCEATFTQHVQSARVDKSLKFSGLSLSTLKTVRLPIPNKDYVESHLVMACAAGKMLHKTGLLHAIHADKMFGESGIKGRIIV